MKFIINKKLLLEDITDVATWADFDKKIAEAPKVELNISQEEKNH